MIFLNEVDLTNAITRGLITAVMHTVGRIKEFNTDSINSVVYDSYSPDWYDRTDDFKNAWETQTSGSGGTVNGEMYYEAGDISTGNTDNGQHVSVVTGASQAQYMPEILYQAGMGCVSRPTHRDAWKHLDSRLTNSMIRQIFEEGLNTSGMQWKRKTGAITVTKTR